MLNYQIHYIIKYILIINNCNKFFNFYFFRGLGTAFDCIPQVVSPIPTGFLFWQISFLNFILLFWSENKMWCWFPSSSHSLEDCAVYGEQSVLIIGLKRNLMFLLPTRLYAEYNVDIKYINIIKTLYPLYSFKLNYRVICIFVLFWCFNRTMYVILCN